MYGSFQDSYLRYVILKLSYEVLQMICIRLTCILASLFGPVLNFAPSARGSSVRAVTCIGAYKKCSGNRYAWNAQVLRGY